jgi:hypothetical protein
MWRRSFKTKVAAGATLSLISPRLAQPKCNAEEPMPATKPLVTPPKGSRPMVGPVELGYCSIVLSHEAEYALPRLRLTAHKQPMTDAGVVRGLAVIGEVLQRKEPFTILWDVRSCSLPSRQQLHIGTEWARTHKPELDKYVPV